MIENPKLPPVVRLVDDDDKVRRSEAFVLELDGWRTRGFASAEAFLAEDDPAAPGCIVLDVRMPGMSGLELQAALRRSGRSIPILFLTGHGDLDMAVAALKRGAADFCTKPIAPKKLQAAAAKLVRWHQAFCRSAAEKEAVQALFAALTPRELEVVRLAAKGLLNKEIAGLLGASEQTVKIHRSNAAKKLDARSAVDFVELLRIADEPLDDRFPIGALDAGDACGANRSGGSGADDGVPA